VRHTFVFTAGLPQLDVHTLSEDWALAASLEAHWTFLAQSMGLVPSRWIDSAGERMYGAVIRLATSFDLAEPVREDDRVEATCEIVSVRKPHALSRTSFTVDGREKAAVELLTSFIVRKVRGSNKKFSKTRDIWTADDVDGERIDDLLDAHHRMKSAPEVGADGAASVMRTEINRIRDFNTADFMYFKNFVVMAKAAEWAHGRGGPTRLNATRECWYYGNVEDGDVVETRTQEAEPGTLVSAHHAPDGRRIFLTRARMEEVAIAVR
jgi:probable biosynthetic protein (TIGR04098 family)